MGNFLHFISHANGLEMVNSGTAAAVRDFSYGTPRVKRYQETEGATASNSQASMTQITFAEMRANTGRSRTARLPEWDTLGRDCKHARELAKDPKRPPEDFVEQAQNKIKMWTRIPLTNPQHRAWATATRAAQA
ncbi:MAG TPA: hypothetical protein DIT28_16555 [Oxalobacteraceae bacterium]|nr:hypothetical protein [Oxalobacteraceae bacterium]